MNATPVTARARLAGLLAVAFALPFLAACENGAPRSASLQLDGRIDEWRPRTVARADDRHLYVRFSLGDELAALQSHDETTRIALDLDGDPATGKPLQGDDAIDALGIDLEVLLSPPIWLLPPDQAQFARRVNGPDARIAPGAAIVVHDATGPRTIGHADARFLFTPTFASDWYEARLDRAAPDLLGSGISQQAEGRGIILLTNPAGGITGYSDPFPINLPEADLQPAPADALLPAQRQGAVRVMSYNILRNAARANPEPFARLIRAAAPDILLLQEADGMDSAAWARWLTENVGPLQGKNDGAGDAIRPGFGLWDAACLPDQGVAIATPHLITDAFQGPITASIDGRERNIRAIVAGLETPQGTVLAASVHLKCCGGYQGPEDATRLAEAQAVNSFFANAAAALVDPGDTFTGLRVIGGDINLVGGREPLDALAQGLTDTGDNLRVAPVMILGDNTTYTWRMDRSLFSPGRLDYVLFDGGRVTNAAAIDTRILSPESLAQHGLEAEDSAASDHLPLIVDIR